jgi:hypothetical protein
MHSTITVAGQVGHLFEGDRTGSYCYVPLHLVGIADNGSVHIDEVEYFRSGWALRNMRGAPTDYAGTYLFPNPERMVTDFSPAPIKAFLVRIAELSNHPFDLSVSKER